MKWISTQALPGTILSRFLDARLFALLLPVLLLNACSTEEDLDAWPYPIKDSEFSVRDGSLGQTVYWLDEHRVLFEGHEGGKPRSPDGWKNIQWGIFIWDVEANVIEKYYVPAEGLCYHDGFIKYFTSLYDGTSILIKGMMGKEKRYPGSFYRNHERTKFRMNRYSCRLDKRPDSMNGRAWNPLLEKHGYLDHGIKNHTDQYPLMYYPANGSGPITLSIGQYMGMPRYSQFSKTYLFSGHFSNAGTFGTSPWKEGGCEYVWDMSPDGEVVSQCLPYYEQLGTAAKFPIKTALGIAMVSHSIDRYGPGKSGIYLYHDGEYERLIAGISENHAISPSGCRIAFYHMLTLQHANIYGGGDTSLVMIDLCSK